MKLFTELLRSQRICYCLVCIVSELLHLVCAFHPRPGRLSWLCCAKCHRVRFWDHSNLCCTLPTCCSSCNKISFTYTDVT